MQNGRVVRFQTAAELATLGGNYLETIINENLTMFARPALRIVPAAVRTNTIRNFASFEPPRLFGALGLVRDADGVRCFLFCHQSLL